MVSIINLGIFMVSPIGFVTMIEDFILLSRRSSEFSLKRGHIPI